MQTHFHSWFRKATLALSTAPLLCSAAFADIAGTGSFQMPAFVDGTGSLNVLYHKPSAASPQSPVVFVLHGVGRNADEYRQAWIAHAERCNFILLVPEFTAEVFSQGAGYQQGGMFGANRQPKPRAEWNFFIIDRVFERVKALGATKRDTFGIYGHSAGAQFLHRYVTFADSSKLDVAIIANSGWYTLPDRDQAYPYGLKGAEVSNDALKRMAAKPVLVLLGDADVDTNDPNLRKSPEANLQGPHRFARGQNYFSKVQAMAGSMATPFNWTLKTVPGVAHSNSLMAPAAAAHFCSAR
ncbi:MAG: hypothetical protein ACRCWF_03720 [Beijerinckiaceae bacterium]